MALLVISKIYHDVWWSDNMPFALYTVYLTNDWRINSIFIHDRRKTHYIHFGRLSGGKVNMIRGTIWIISLNMYVLPDINLMGAVLILLQNMCMALMGPILRICRCACIHIATLWNENAFLHNKYNPQLFRVLHRNSNSSEITFGYHLNSNKLIAAKCCTWHESCAVQMSSNWITVRLSFHWIWIARKLYMINGPCFDVKGWHARILMAIFLVFLTDGIGR